jgi:hypothetical protein
MRYFFHVREGESYLLDDEGLELADVASAFAAATAGARSIIAAEAVQGNLPLRAIIEVDDEKGTRVFDLPFRETIRVDG